ncbi:hypothetical protein [Vreelandella arctica]|uniref:Uncharacterized protein n=1 Tax=Halomonas sp. ZM3 TaxID=1250400 RepID=K7SJM6_9GAMM|nr:hypothetical protein [Halomonas sp. ZM3]
MKDRWCRPLDLPDGRTVSGGAARNVRLAEGGGVEQVLRDFLNDIDERISGGASHAQQVRPKSRPAHPTISTKPGKDRPTMH